MVISEFDKSLYVIFIKRNYFMKNLLILCLFFSLSNLNLNAQEISGHQWDIKKVNKGKLFIFAGWNWARYTSSDIHFKGVNHNFTLSKVKAEDRPSKFSAELYLNPKNISIPQTNLKIGYFFHNNWNLAFGIDHMKYVVTPLQTVGIDGQIQTGSSYDGVYDNDQIKIWQSFLEYEHTDGLNFIHFEINRFDRLITTRFFDFNVIEGLSFGPIVPRTDVTLLNQGEWDKYHLAGYGSGLKLGLNITFFNYFHIQSEAKGGFIHLPDVKTTPVKTDKASQSFWYFQHNFLFGAVFPIIKKSKRITLNEE